MSATAIAIEPRKSEAEVWAEINKFLGKTDFELTLTFAILPEPIVFPVRLAMTDDEIAARMKFYSQPAEAQASGRQSYHAAFMSSLLTGKPRGLPMFDELADAADASSLDDYKALLDRYLSTPGELADMIGSNAVELYNRGTKPAEFFR